VLKLASPNHGRDWQLQMLKTASLPFHIGLSVRGTKNLPAQSDLCSSIIELKGFSIPQVTIKTGLTTPDGREEQLTEYLCDHPGCPNIATHVLGWVVELRMMAAVCDEHAPKPRH
jgi:hypothetical protein